MPFPQWLARLNKVGLNRVAKHVAPALPGLGVVVHKGRRSGRAYQTPVNVFRTPDGFVIALTYGAEKTEWVKNVVAAGGCEVPDDRQLTRPIALADFPLVSMVPFPARGRRCPMPVVPPAAPESDPRDPIGLKYPNTARVWNYHLRGKDNFPVDRQAAEAVEAMSRKIGVPLAADTAVEGRHLLQRMVDYLLGQGIRQFLDLGSGLPSMANTHQIAHRVAPEARVVYIDIDPMVSSHASARMAGSNVATLRADLREPEQVLSDPQVRDTLDFGQPVGIMFSCVLHCLWDQEDPWAVVRQFRDAAAPGSYLALSHMTNEAHPEGAQALFQMTQDLHWNTPLISRSRADIARLFDGFTLVEPGVVPPAQWRPELHHPLVSPREDDGDDAPVLSLVVPERPRDDRGAAWHLCGIGIKP